MLPRALYSRSSSFDFSKKNIINLKDLKGTTNAFSTVYTKSCIVRAWLESCGLLPQVCLMWPRRTHQTPAGEVPRFLVSWHSWFAY